MRENHGYVVFSNGFVVGGGGGGGRGGGGGLFLHCIQFSLAAQNRRLSPGCVALAVTIAMTFMMTSSTGHLWIPLAKASNAEVWCFLWCAPEQTAEQTVDMLVILDALVLIMTSL